jgi:hypothetical protein
LAVQSLKMVRGYYHSAAAEATAAVAKGAADIAADGGDGGLQSELWEPLLQVPFVEGLWQQLGQRWQRFAFCQPPSAQLSTGEASSGTSTSLLSSYIAAGGFPLPQLAKVRRSCCPGRTPPPLPLSFISWGYTHAAHIRHLVTYT